jgi:hypothetical protein
MSTRHAISLRGPATFDPVDISLARKQEAGPECRFDRRPAGWALTPTHPAAGRPAG